MISGGNIRNIFAQIFGREAALVARAPGRINLIGEHTDYNGGFVLPAAIEFEIKMAARPAEGSIVRAWSENYNEAFEFDAATALTPPAEPRWYSYLMAVVDQFQQRGFTTPGFEVVIHGDIPPGAGLSSSAAFEVCAAVLLNELCQAGLSLKNLALLAQAAEHSPFVGVRCGIMDQFASALGVENSALQIDCYTLETEAFPFNSAMASIVIINSNKSRELRNSEFNTRRKECEEGLAMLDALCGGNYETLRHVPAEVFARHQHCLPPKIAQRVRHNLTENQRVKDFVEALRRSRWQVAGDLLYQSHASLRDDYEVSCPELDTIVDLAANTGLAYGCRMTGGGFGGCAVALVPPENVAEFSARLAPEYKARTGISPDIYATKAAAGARLER